VTPGRRRAQGLRAKAVGVDLGGTKIAAGIVDDEGRILGRQELPSDIGDASSVQRQICELVRSLGAEGVVGVGIGAAGIVDNATGHYLYGPNTGLRDFNLAELVGAELGLAVQLDNDANCAAWAEHRFGVGRGTRNFICVTLGTGIGGGFVIDGRPYRGAHGGAAEIGHMIVDPNGPPCGCGRRGCWEQFASGLALERTALAELSDHTDSALVQELHRGRVPGPAITRAARDGDAFARDLVERMARWVGWGLGSLVNILEPERIAIAGGIASDWDILAPTAMDGMRERVEASDRRPLPDVERAELGPDAGIVGAALLVLAGSSPS
jgi:glucokinase